MNLNIEHLSHRNPSNDYSQKDYHPGGMVMPGREFSNFSYDFGFNGKLKDDEIKESGNSLDFGERMYDPRISIWLRIDPRASDMPGYSSYSFAVGNPILYMDPDGEYPISIHLRSFAPFDYFGPGALWGGDGDNRPFSTSSQFSSRIRMVTNYETETQVGQSAAFGSASHSKYGAYAYSDAYLNDGKRQITTQGSSFDLHLYGKNEALFPSSVGPSPGERMNPTYDIDLHNRLSIDAMDGMLSISGQINGDQFPSTELFVSDDYGTSIFLGTAPTSYGPIEGPTKQLRGDKDLPMINVNIRISVGENGAFQGVYNQDNDGNEIIISPDAWNKQYENQSPISGQDQ
ncbi:MAG: hypothetical protein IPO83_03270 [Chitinophagaceae bacterium]|nr:hypothetical protein [Chitinophagaceae bacterium]